jgi:hypothetical protein
MDCNAPAPDRVSRAARWIVWVFHTRAIGEVERLAKLDNRTIHRHMIVARVDG